MGVSGHHGYEDADGRWQRPGGFLLLGCGRVPSFPTVSLLPSNCVALHAPTGALLWSACPGVARRGVLHRQLWVRPQQQPGDVVEALQVL